MNQQSIKAQLSRKSEIVEKICKNNEKLRRFIHKRNMLGVKRVLQETNNLIEELSAIDNLLRSQSDTGWQDLAEFRAITNTLKLQQTAMIASYQQTVQEATAERHSIAAELRDLKAKRLLGNHYSRQWPLITAGRRLSVKG